MPGFLRVILIVLAVVVVLVALLVLVRRRMAQAGIYLTLRTKFGPVLIFTVEGDDGEPVRILNVGGVYQSATYLDDDRVYDLVFEYTKLYDKMFEAQPAADATGQRPLAVRRALMIGGGGYSYPKHFISEHPEASMDVVEIDPTITGLAQRYFFLDRLFAEFDLDETGRLGLVCDDGRAFLEQRASAEPSDAPRYDVILNDSFSGKEPVASLATVEAARLAHACLNEGGLYMTNVVSALSGEQGRLIRAVVATLSQVFAHVYVIPCEDEDEFADRDNNMVIASDGLYDFPGACDVARLNVGPDDPVLTDANNPVLDLAK
ncbi:MAG: fused MFS/spermidine synthase [Coriobacteriia bacterium]|nr:fused MFS/spermidine synthase [Coriobacteriia bacterium]MBS5477596.1 fused MFS/spermidine synthase [Coriobacteriia bacterium]